MGLWVVRLGAMGLGAMGRGAVGLGAVGLGALGDGALGDAFLHLTVTLQNGHLLLILVQVSSLSFGRFCLPD